MLGVPMEREEWLPFQRTFKVLHGIFWSSSLFWVALETGLGCLEISQILVLENCILFLFSEGQDSPLWSKGTD